MVESKDTKLHLQTDYHFSSLLIVQENQLQYIILMFLKTLMLYYIYIDFPNSLAYKAAWNFQAVLVVVH